MSKFQLGLAKINPLQSQHGVPKWKRAPAPVAAAVFAQTFDAGGKSLGLVIQASDREMSP